MFSFNNTDMNNRFANPVNSNNKRTVSSALSLEERLSLHQANKAQRTRNCAVPIGIPSRNRDTDSTSSSKDALIQELLQDRAMLIARLDICEQKIEQLTSQLEMVSNSLIQLQESRAPPAADESASDDRKHVKALGVRI